MATQLAERTQSPSPIAVFRQTLSTPAMREQMKMALPNHIPVERFERVAVTAVQQNPDLLNPQKVERNSLFGALVKAAQDGLLPDGREGAIVPFRGKAQWMPMVAGIMTKVRRSGEIANWEVAAVFEKDEFERLLGDDQRIFHKPYEDGDPGQVIGAYSIVTFKDGSKSRDYLPRWRIEKAREQNPIGKNSLMWTKFYDEGAVKTVIRHHSKRLPMSTDVEAIFARDETMTPPGGFRHSLETVPDEPQPMGRLDAIEHQIGGSDVATPEPKPVVTDEDPPAEAEVITEQAEELEAEIEQPAEVNDQADDITTADEPHPAQAKADAIMAEIRDPATNAIMDVNAIITREQLAISSMPDWMANEIEAVAQEKREAIRTTLEAAKAKETAE
jgi:recombination protein RecT